MITGIWIAAALLYAAFYAWYVGFSRKLTPDEIDNVCKKLTANHAPEQVAAMRRILEEDTGREFFMVNLIKLREKNGSLKESREILEKYTKPFLGAMLRRAGHPIAFARAAAPAIELWGIENAKDWNFAAFIRYRSRRDMAAVITLPAFQDNHHFKMQGIEKTFAFPGDPCGVVGGPKLLVPVLLFAIAAGLTLLMR